MKVVIGRKQGTTELKSSRTAYYQFYGISQYIFGWHGDRSRCYMNKGGRKWNVDSLCEGRDVGYCIGRKRRSTKGEKRVKF